MGETVFLLLQGFFDGFLLLLLLPVVVCALDCGRGCLVFWWEVAGLDRTIKSISGMGSCLFNCSIGCNGDGDGAASTRLTRMYWLQGCPFGAFNIGSSHMNVELEPHVNRI